MVTETSLSRRTVLKGGAAAAAALALSSFTPERVRAAVAETARSGVFGFGVASGDPTATEVLLWTRVTPTPDAVPGSGVGLPTAVGWELAADEGFAQVVASGTTTTDAGRDHTVKVVVSGLDPYTRWWYRFTAGGETSPVGRTQTAPDEPGMTHALRLAFVSCSNWTGGYFTAYRGIAARDDLDLVLHLGDYLYEYGNGEDRYGPAALAGVRDHQPPVEALSLADYRVRHALYKTDPDLQAAHQRHPWTVVFDDHETANDAWSGGAEDHEDADDPDTAGVRPEGDFAARRAGALQAYREWMPIREPEGWQPQPHQGTQFFRRFTFGDLAELSVVETRQHRSQQVPTTVGGALNPALADPARHLVEPEQRDWLTRGLTGGRTSWHLIGSQTLFARVLATPAPGVLAGQVANSDPWDGYQADQQAVLAAMAGSTGADPVVLTGDVHSSWASELPTDHARYPVDRNSVGVEFVCPSVTSDGPKEALGGTAAAEAVAVAVPAANPWVRYLDGIGHGFVVLDVTPERVQADWWFIRSGGDKGLLLDPRLDPQATVGHETSLVTLRGSRQVSGPVPPLGPRSDSPRSAAR
ncbi:alkaline phosphatase D family protein [Modestobacter italicus]|nr:alkaline phosphatase D family protein [Modestobacter marinus]